MSTKEISLSDKLLELLEVRERTAQVDAYLQLLVLLDSSTKARIDRLALMEILCQRIDVLCSSGNIDVTDEMLEQIRKVGMNHVKDTQEQS